MLNSKKDLLKYLRPVIGLGLLAFLFYRIPLGKVATTLSRTNPLWIIVAAFISLIAISVSSWKLLSLAKLDLKEVKFSSILKVYYIGHFFNNFLPTSIGGDIMKVNELRKEGLSTRKSGAAVVVERGTGFFIVALLAFFLAIFWGGIFRTFELTVLRLPVILAGFIGFLLIIPFYFTWQKKLKPFLKKRADHHIWGKVYKIFESFFVFRDNPRVFEPILLLSVVFYGLGAFKLLVIAKSLGISLNYWYALGILTVMTFISLLPVSLGALGIKEGAIVYCLSHLGLTPAEGLSVALLLRFVTYIHSGIGGLVYFFNSSR